MKGPRIALSGVHQGLAALRHSVVYEVEDVNRLIFHVLRAGVVLSVGLIAFAFLLHAAGAGPLPSTPVPARGLADELVRLTPTGFLSLGVLVLIFTPVTRVLASLVSFAEERERAYVLITGIVLANLLVSLVLGLG